MNSQCCHLPCALQPAKQRTKRERSNQCCSTGRLCCCCCTAAQPAGDKQHSQDSSRHTPLRRQGTHLAVTPAVGTAAIVQIQIQMLSGQRKQVRLAACHALLPSAMRTALHIRVPAPLQHSRSLAYRTLASTQNTSSSGKQAPHCMEPRPHARQHHTTLPHAGISTPRCERVTQRTIKNTPRLPPSAAASHAEPQRVQKKSSHRASLMVAGSGGLTAHAAPAAATGRQLGTGQITGTAR